MQRIANVDAVKVTGLMCLYVSHGSLLTAYPQINNLLQVFLDNAFMFLAGYFCYKSLSKREFNFKSFWNNKLGSFLIPFWIIIFVWFVSQRGTTAGFRPIEAFFAYGLGLRAFVLPVEWDLFSLWFASSLLGFFVLFSLFGKYKKTVLFTVSIIVILSYTILSSYMYWNWYYYLIPFTVGYLWKYSLNNKKMLLSAPLILLSLIPEIFSTSFIVNNICYLLCGLGLTLTSLYLFSKLKLNDKTAKALTYVASGSLIIYLMEPIFGMWTGWLIHPQYLGNASVQFLLTPMQSLTRLIIVVPLAFLLSPLMMKAIQKVIIVLQRLELNKKTENVTL